MRVVLSRKGFDSVAGGKPSPVLPDHTMLSLPIPEIPDIKLRTYDELNIDSEIKKFYKLSGKWCHLDPDIRAEFWELEKEWYPAFGQCASSGGHLKRELALETDKEFQEEILFLFFGWFQHWNGDHLYDKSFQAVWGYMVCDRVIRTQREMPNWHPHAHFKSVDNNLLFVAKEDCCGTFKYCEDLKLTAPGQKPSRWKKNCLPWFDADNRNANMTYHKSTKCFKDDYFQSVGRGQEFVVTTPAKTVDNLDWTHCDFAKIMENLQKMYK